MKIKAVVFDKDGTLVDFAAYWKEVATFAAKKMFPALGVENPDIEEHLSELGLSSGGVDISGALPRGDHAAMASLIYEFAKRSGSKANFDEAVRAFAEAYGREAKESGTVRPTTERLAELIAQIKNRGIIVALITSDEPSGAEVCLQKLGVIGEFDELLAYDGVTPAKPDPAFMLKLCEKYGISPREVVMVGDTETDMLFAKNSGSFAIGLSKAKRNSEILFSAGADAVISDLWQLFDYL